MSASPDMSEEGKTAWHASQAWRFIAIAARAIDQEPTPAPVPVQKDSCFCHDGASLQTVSGGAAPEGYLGTVTLLIDGEYVDYVKAQPAQEPIGYAVPTFDFDNSVIKKVHYSGTVPLYTAPPQRPWVGLTAEEATKCCTISAIETWFNFENALRIKNT